MLHRSGNSRRMAGVALLVGLLAALLATSSAEAAITTSSVTAPADGSLLFLNHDSNPTQAFTVSGTTDGTTGDLVDIRCYNAGSAQGGSYMGPAAAGITVAVNGSFTASVPLSDFTGSSCELLAVPHGTTPQPPTGLTGPRVGFSRFGSSRLTSGPNTGETYDFTLTQAGLGGLASAGSISNCGPYSQLYDMSATMSVSPFLLNCAGSFFDSPAEFFTNTTTVDITRSEVQVDGMNAYGSLDAQQLFAGSTSNSGFPALSVAVSFNSTTGDAQSTESENLVRCSPTDVYKPTATDCSSFVASGVRLRRVVDYSGGGRVQTVTDTYSGMDASAHTLDLEYDTDLNDPTAGWELPGQSVFSPHATGDTAPAPSTAPGTIYGIDNRALAAGFANPVAAMTFATPYNSIRFDNTLWSGYGSGEPSALIDYQRTVPAGGQVTITWNYATGTSMSEVEAAADRFSPPSISISSPANVSTPAGPVTVTGSASAGSGVHGVTVNGIQATVTGGNWSASVPLSSGTLAVTAIVTSNGGVTASSSETLHRAKPVAATRSASHLTAAGAKLMGTVTPGSAAVSYHFEYGKTTAYGASTASKSLPAGMSALAVSRAIAGLHAATRYHYQLIARSSVGTSLGGDRTFKTTPPPPKKVSASVSPHHARSAPYKFHVTGSIKLRSGVSHSAGCRGTVTVVVKHGRHTIATIHGTVSGKCDYSVHVTLSATKLPGNGKLTFAAHFGGNAVVGPAAARPAGANFG